MSELQLRNHPLPSNSQKLVSELRNDLTFFQAGIKPLPQGKIILYGFVPAVSLYLVHYYLVLNDPTCV
jgi:hypothetical protein